MPSWDDLRVALALHEHGTLVAAGKVLRIDPTTVGRRVHALEQDLGIPVFVRTGASWTATHPGLRVMETAARAAEVLEDLHRIPVGYAAPHGPVRVTTIESIASNLIAPILPEFSRLYPEVRVHLWCSIRRLEIGRDAEIAVRVGDPGGPELIARRLAFLHGGFHASPAWLEDHGLKAAQVDSLEGLPLVSIGRPGPTLQGLGRFREVLRSDSVLTVARAAQEGAGVAFLPNLIARGLGLVPLTALPTRDNLPIWCVTHADLLRLPRVRVLFDAIVEAAPKHAT